MSPDLMIHVSTSATAGDAWKYLASRFDRDTGSTSINLFRQITNLRYNDGEDLRHHLDVFHGL
ncbi:hypothetical protein BU24DRAFT_356646, partial [Aaosphaeria arxii CBS 175.79]